MSDSELRQRQPSPATSAKALPKMKKGPGSPPPPNPPLASSAARRFILAVSLALSVILLCLRNFHSSVPASSYILCSPPGTQQIYTVDHDDSKVECMAIHGDFIIDTGARGMSHEPISLFKTSVRGSFPPADLTDRYSSYKLIHIKLGAIVVPGLTGKSTSLPQYHIIVFFISRPPDSHVHALEYGAQRQIPMEDARNAFGEAAAFASYQF